MLVSLVVPVYNVSSCLPKLLESIRSQTHHELEIILVNDGSTDDSGAICDSYALKDSRIKTVHTPNRSAADARNTGVGIASCFDLALHGVDLFHNILLGLSFQTGNINMRRHSMTFCQNGARLHCQRS